MRIPKKLGLVRDPVDQRDFLLAEAQPSRVKLPDTFDLRDKMSPIGSQGNIGSCTSWGTTALAEYWNNKEYQQIINLSERFVYHNIKRVSGWWDWQGDSGRNGLKALVKWGAPLLKDWPNKTWLGWKKYLKERPPLRVYQKAAKYKAKTYWSVGKNLEQIRQAMLQNNCPVMTGIKWHKSYNKTEKDGKLKLPYKSVGGHCIACVGWVGENLWFRNSFSAKWGLRGYFYIPFKEFGKHEWWNAWILLDLPALPEIDTGWVAESYLLKELKKEMWFVRQHG